uniref:Uncharacterized protein n=1 Tax=Strongyloides papillosus TaxID=174720 RepID=A0A0N5BK04_STREA
MGCIQYEGEPARGANITVIQKYIPGFYRTLMRFNCDHRGCFCFQANYYFFSLKNGKSFNKNILNLLDLKIKAKSFHMEGKLLCKISGTFIFPIKSAVTCINRDIIPDLDKVELADIPGIKKTCKPRLRNRVRSKTYKINSG